MHVPAHPTDSGSRGRAGLSARCRTTCRRRGGFDRCARLHGHYAYLRVAERVRLAAAAVDSAPRWVSRGCCWLRCRITVDPLRGAQLVPGCHGRPGRAIVRLRQPGDHRLHLRRRIARRGCRASEGHVGEFSGLRQSRPRRARAALRTILPAHVTIGVAGDRFAAEGLLAGCDAWYSVIGGVLPEPALALLRAASIARELTLVDADCLPRPLLPLDAAVQGRVCAALGRITSRRPAPAAPPASPDAAPAPW